MQKSGEAPNESFFSEACRQRFLDIVQEFQPRHLIVLGTRTFEHLPGNQKDIWTVERVANSGDKFEIWTLHYKGVSVKVLNVYHPAWMGMSIEDFEKKRNRIRYFLSYN